MTSGFKHKSALSDKIDGSRSRLRSKFIKYIFGISRPKSKSEAINHFRQVKVKAKGQGQGHVSRPKSRSETIKYFLTHLCQVKVKIKVKGQGHRMHLVADQ